MSNNNILRLGWRNDDALWRNIPPQAKDSIREIVATVLSYRNPKEDRVYSIERWIQTQLPHFCDRRFLALVPRYGKTQFWTYIDEFACVTNRIINKDYCSPYGASVLRNTQQIVIEAATRYNMFVRRGVQPCQ